MATQEGCCVECKKPASTRCAGCIEGVDIDGQRSPTFYCSKECQKAHWNFHKSECKNTNYRKQLYRAGELAQRVYYDVRQHLWEVPIEKIEKRDGRLYLDLGKTRGNAFEFEFDESLFGEDKDKYAVLVTNRCDNAVAQMHNFVEAALKGSYSKLEEARLVVAEDKKRVIYPMNRRGDISHVTFKVSLKDGKSYAFDLTGAQFGRYRTITPWEAYEKDMFVGGWDAERTERSAVELYAALHNSGTPILSVCTRLIAEMDKAVMNLLGRAVGSWLEREKESVAAMMTGKAEVFAQKSENFQLFAQGFIDELAK